MGYQRYGKALGLVVKVASRGRPSLIPVIITLPESAPPPPLVAEFLPLKQPLVHPSHQHLSGTGQAHRSHSGAG